MATLHFALEEEEDAQVWEMYPCYRTIAGHSEIDPLVRRRMYDHLADLARFSTLNRSSRNEGRRGGQYYEYEFDVDLRTVREVVRGWRSSRGHIACDTSSETERTLDAVWRLCGRTVLFAPVTFDPGRLQPEVGALLYLGAKPRDRMRILRIAPWIYPDTKGGGDYHVHAMSRDQAAMGHDVTVLTTR